MTTAAKTEGMWTAVPAAGRRPGLVLLLGIAALTSFASAAPVTDEARDTLCRIGERVEQGETNGITGAIVSVGGEVIVEAYGPRNNAGKRHDIRSATKSITALLVGELLEDGRLRNVRVPLADLIPATFESLPPDDVRRRITVEDALTMRTGLACDDWVPASVGHEDKMYRSSDWAEFLLSQPMAYERGEHFSYCTGGVILLGRVIAELSGKPVPGFARERLFGPLGIEKERWAETPAGYTDTGGHLRLRLKDLHTIGELILANGQWQGEQLVSRAWLEAATTAQTAVRERREQYGYLWWLDQGQVQGVDVSLKYAHGNGGNFIFVVPELELVAAFTGRNYGKPEQFIPLELLSREIVPALAASR